MLVEEHQRARLDPRLLSESDRRVALLFDVQGASPDGLPYGLPDYSSMTKGPLLMASLMASLMAMLTLEIPCLACTRSQRRSRSRSPALHAHAHNDARAPRRRWPRSRGIPYAYSTWRCHLMGRRSSPAQATRLSAFGMSSLARRPRETPPTLPRCSISKGAPPSANPAAQPSAIERWRPDRGKKSARREC